MLLYHDDRFLFHDDKFRGYYCISWQTYNLLVCLYFWPLCCLFFFDLRILITSLVSSNSSWHKCISIITICFLTTTIGSYHDDTFRGYNCISAYTYNWYKCIFIIKICFYTTTLGFSTAMTSFVDITVLVC